MAILTCGRCGKIIGNVATLLGLAESHEIEAEHAKTCFPTRPDPEKVREAMHWFPFPPVDDTRY